MKSYAELRELAMMDLVSDPRQIVYAADAELEGMDALQEHVKELEAVVSSLTRLCDARGRELSTRRDDARMAEKYRQALHRVWEDIQSHGAPVPPFADWVMELIGRAK
jgi:DNA repair ATPase RecN